MFRVGIGFDVHRFAPDRPMILMGCEIPHPQGLLGHSDADVMLHALMDALLGAAGLGDIGGHFPDSDPAYKGISSLKLLEKVMESLRQEGWRLVNADVGLIGERPKIGPYREQMAAKVAPLLGVEAGALNIKATTTEKLGFTGRGEGLGAQAIVLLESETL